MRFLIGLLTLCFAPAFGLLPSPQGVLAQHSRPIVVILESADPSVLAPELRQAFVDAGMPVISAMDEHADHACATLSLFVEEGARDVRLRLRTRAGSEEGGYLRAGRRAAPRGRWMIGPIRQLVERTLAQEALRARNTPDIDDQPVELLDPWDAPRDPSVVVIERVPLTEMMDPWNNLRRDSTFANVPVLREVLDPWDGTEEGEMLVEGFDAPIVNDLVDPWHRFRPNAANLSEPPPSPAPRRRRR